MKRSLSLRALNGKPYTVDIDPNATVFQLKCVVAEKIAANQAEITLIHHSHILSDGALISSLKMEGENDFIVIHIPSAPPVISSQPFILVPQTATKVITDGISLKKTLPPKPVKTKQRRVMNPDEDKIQQIAEITGYQYSREEIQRVLAQHDGNVEIAVRHIFTANVTPAPVVKETAAPVAEAPRPMEKKAAKKKTPMVDLSELSRINFGQFAGLISDYTIDEKVDLLKLIHRHRAHFEVTYLLQMFHACDKILEAVEHNLAAVG